MPTKFRFPYGIGPCGSERYLRGLGYTVTGWHIDSADWCFASGGVCTSGEYSFFRWVPNVMRRDMTAYLLHQLRMAGGGIILFHDIRRYSVDSLDSVLAAIKAAGFSFTSLDDATAFPRLNGDTSAPGRHIAKLGAACKTNYDCDYGLPAYLGFCHTDGYCSMLCEDRCRVAATSCRSDMRVSDVYKVCTR